LHLAENRGNSDNDIRHIAVINYIWELPLGRGKGYRSNGVLGKILEGMQFSGITTAQGGQPFQLRTRRDSARTGVGSWASQMGDPFGPAPTPECQPSGGKVYFTNGCAFEEPVFGAQGSTGRNQFYGPGLVDFDLTFSKKMKLTERIGAELRFEGYNIFNHPHFQNPGTDSANIGNLVTGNPLASVAQGQGPINPLFGVSTATFTQPDGTTSARQMQVALKITL
jgi:hypothetical protein